MNAFVIFAVAKQQDGNFCVVKPESAFWEESQASQALLKSAVLSTELVPTEFGNIACDVERAVFKIVLPDIQPAAAPEDLNQIHYPEWGSPGDVPSTPVSPPVATFTPSSVTEGDEYELLTPE